MNTRHKLAQSIIALRRPIVVDGHFGPMSALALNRSPQDVREVVNDLAQELDWRLPDVVNEMEMDQLVDEYAQKFDVPRSYLASLVILENTMKDGNYIVEHEGTHRGLGQFDRPTWKAVMNEPFFNSVLPSKSMEAISRLYAKNKDSYLAKFPDGEYTDEIAYLYHNQGAPAAAVFLETGNLVYPMQSKKAITLFAVARNKHEKSKRFTV